MFIQLQNIYQKGAVRMNRIEERLEKLRLNNEKAFITYITAGLPDMDRTLKIILEQEKAGVDIIEIGVPFSDPVADGVVIQAASYKSIQKGTNLKNIFIMIKELRTKSNIPIVFMMYYNMILHYGVKEFVEKCIEAGVDGLIIPDLPFEEQGEMNNYLAMDKAPILIQLVAPTSKGRVPKILKDARGFVYCVSTMGVTGQSTGFHKNVINYLKEVKAVSKIPVMIGFGIKEASDVDFVKDIIDGAIVGSHLIQLMEKNEYDCDIIRNYCSDFKAGINRFK